MDRPPFVPFPKIPRLRRHITITEKIDGSNAQIVITGDGRALAGSRNRWITPEDDNFGFARWVHEHHDELVSGLGKGQHFGEWWGSGIQRGYGLTVGEKRFSLFNTHRWSRKLDVPATHPPACCGVVPVLYTGPYSDSAIQDAITLLSMNGSSAMPGFMDPEGVVVYMHASGSLHKVLIKGDDLPKGAV